MASKWFPYYVKMKSRLNRRNENVISGWLGLGNRKFMTLPTFSMNCFFSQAPKLRAVVASLLPNRLPFAVFSNRSMQMRSFFKANFDAVSILAPRSNSFWRFPYYCFATIFLQHRWDIAYMAYSTEWQSVDSGSLAKNTMCS